MGVSAGAPKPLPLGTGRSRWGRRKRAGVSLAPTGPWGGNWISQGKLSPGLILPHPLPSGPSSPAGPN